MSDIAVSILPGLAFRGPEKRMSEAPGRGSSGHNSTEFTRFDAAPLSTEQQTEFVQQNMRRVFLLIYRIVGNVADAQDLTQEAFIKALQRQEQLKDLEKAAHWLSRIASNTAIDFLRRSGRVSFSDIDEMVVPVASPVEDSPEQQLLRGEHREHLEAGLNSLTGRERTALLLRDVEGLSAEDACAVLKITSGNQRILLHRGRAHLRQALEDNVMKNRKKKD